MPPLYLRKGVFFVQKMGSTTIFGNGREQMRQQSDLEKDELYKQIGQLKVELDFLKKRAGLID